MMPATGGVTIAVPSKGRLKDPAIDLLRRSGLRFRVSGRRLFSECAGSDHRLIFANTADIPLLVAEGMVDLGITGQDNVLEAGVEVTEHHTLGFGRCRMALAVHRDAEFALPAGLAGCRIGSSFRRITERFLAEQGVDNATVIPIKGAVEVTVLLGMVDAIVDIVETGNSLLENDLVEAATILHSEAVVVGSPSPSDPGQVAQMVRRIEGVLHADRYSLLEYNIRRSSIAAATEITPGFSSPTIQDMADPDWVAVKVLVPKDSVPGVMDRLDAVGASAILEIAVRNSRL